MSKVLFQVIAYPADRFAKPWILGSAPTPEVVLALAANALKNPIFRSVAIHKRELDPATPEAARKARLKKALNKKGGGLWL